MVRAKRSAVPACVDKIDLAPFIPKRLRHVENQQTAIPRIAKDKQAVADIEDAVRTIPKRHTLYRHDSRTFDAVPPNSVHLVVTSPPYWTLKHYNPSEGQLGYVADYEDFLRELDKVWRMCFQALVPGGRLVCVVGDVCLSRRKNAGEHTVVPLHASIHSRMLPPHRVHERGADYLVQDRQCGV